MFEYVCEVCGETKSVHARRDIGRFCSWKCSGISKRRIGYEPKVKKVGECVFQPDSIRCRVRNCDNCGWNPVVAKARLEAYGERKN